MGFLGVKNFTSKGDVRVNFRTLLTGGQAPEKPDAATPSTVVEARGVVADQCLLPWSPCPAQRVVADVVHRGGWSDALCDVATPVVALDEHPSRIAACRWQPRVPDIGNEERNIARFGYQWYGTEATPLQIDVGQPIERRRPS